MRKGIVIFNLKTYVQVNFNESLKILKEIESLNDERIYLSPPINSLDYLNIRKKKCQIISQNVDSIETGAFTGSTNLELLMKNKVDGTLINHSERRAEKQFVRKVCDYTKNTSFKTIICCENLREALEFQKYNPSYIAYEPRELIGSGISVSNAKPEIVKTFCSKIKNPLIGAGITSIQDVEKGIELGANGFLIASAFVKTKNKKKYAKQVLEILDTI
ncbi:Triosephosphate isomerase [uncultured archaeon]|nr:Triosephosphate isomerase [uncultured archaeon]